MSAGNYDIYLENGATYSLPITYKDGSGNTVDLTGYTARMQIRRTVNSIDTQIELTTENGRINYTNQAAGQFTLDMSAADTANLVGGVYDLEIESSGGVVSRILQGKVMASKNVTR